MSKSPFVANLQKQFDSLNVTRCALKNVNGFFIDTEQLSQIEEEINSHLSNPDATDVAEVLVYKEEIETLRQSEAKLLKELSRVRADATALAKGLEQTQAEHAATEKLLISGKESLEKDKKFFTEKLAAAKKELASVKAAGKDPANKFDPETALDYDTRLSEARLSVEMINKDLSRINQDKAALQKKYNASVHDVKSLKEQHHLLKQQITEAQSLQASVSVKEFPKQAPKVKINSDLVKRLVGQKGLTWLQKAVDTEHANVRERVYNTMLAAKSGKTSNINDIFGLLEIVFKWVVNAAHKARLSITSWLDELTADFAAGAVKSAREYRVKLEAIVGDLKQQAEAAKAKTLEAAVAASKRTRTFVQMFVDEAYVWSGLIYNRSKRSFIKGRKALGSLARSIKGWFLGHVKQPSEEDELLFEVPVLPIKMNDKS